MEHDLPFVITGLLEASELPNLRRLASSVRRTNPSSQASREAIRELVRARWPLAEAGWRWDEESEDEEQWGCKLRFPQCSFSFWPLGRKLDDPRPQSGGGFEQGHTVCIIPLLCNVQGCLAILQMVGGGRGAGVR